VVGITPVLGPASAPSPFDSSTESGVEQLKTEDAKTAADIEDGRDGTFSLLLRQLTVGDSDPFQASGCSLRSSSERRPSSPLAASGTAAVTAMVIVEVEV
jgi:hypothetical protein